MVPTFEMSTYFYSNVIWLESGPKMSTFFPEPPRPTPYEKLLMEIAEAGDKL